MEKWNYDLKIKSKGGADKQKKEIDVAKIKDRYGSMHIDDLPELEKNKKELEAIGKINDALQKALEDLVLPPIVVFPENIRIIDEEEFQKKFEVSVVHDGKNVSGVPGGLFIGGNVYIPRKKDGIDIFTLIHEVCHKASYYQIECVDYGQDDSEQTANLKRMGLRAFSRNGDQYFDYLDEVITELFSRKVAELYEGEKVMAKSDVYREGIKVINELIKLAGERDLKKEEALLKEAFVDYFNGKHSFLRKIESVKKGSIAAMRKMGQGKPSPEISK